MIRPQKKWVSIGASTPPVARRSSAQTAPRTDCGEAQHRIASGQGRDDVDQRRDDGRIGLAERGIQRAAEVHFLGDAVDHRDQHDQPQRALPDELQHPGDIVGHCGDLAGHQPADHERAAEHQADDGAGDHRALVASAEPHTAEMQRAGRERAIAHTAASASVSQ